LPFCLSAALRISLLPLRPEIPAAASAELVRAQDVTIPQRGGGTLNAKIFAPGRGFANRTVSRNFDAARRRRGNFERRMGGAASRVQRLLVVIITNRNRRGASTITTRQREAALIF
jgi:hypothetical protein